MSEFRQFKARKHGENTKYFITKFRYQIPVPFTLYFEKQAQISEMFLCYDCTHNVGDTKMTETKNIAFPIPEHTRIVNYTKKSETLAQGAMRGFTESDHIDTLKEAVERVAEQVEDLKKSGRRNPSVADELIRVVRDFIADVEAR